MTHHPARHTRVARALSFDGDSVHALRRASAVFIGCGALGSMTVTLLARAGVGHLRLIDRDVVTWSNLSDQVLYNERDAVERSLKVEAAAKALAAIDGTLLIEPIVADCNRHNVEKLVAGCDVILDGVDNLPTKYLLNDAAVKGGVSWVYAGCAGTLGTVLSIIPGVTPCLRCVWPSPPSNAWTEGCASRGLLPSTAAVTAGMQASEALKILLGRTDELLRDPLSFDIWGGRFRSVPVVGLLAKGQCPACGRGEFSYLDGSSRQSATVLCGGDAVLVNPDDERFDFARVADRLASDTTSSRGNGYVRFSSDGCDIVLFATGRAIVHGTDNPVTASAIYGRYVAP